MADLHPRSTVKRTPTNQPTEWIKANGLRSVWTLASVWGQTRDQLIVRLHQTWPIIQPISHFLFCLPNAWHQWYAPLILHTTMLIAPIASNVLEQISTLKQIDDWPASIPCSACATRHRHVPDCWNVNNSSDHWEANDRVHIEFQHFLHLRHLECWHELKCVIQ